MNNEEILELYNNLKEWHSTIVSNLKFVSNDNRDKTLKISNGDEMIELSKEEEKGFRAACGWAVEMLTPFPLEDPFSDEEE